MEPQNQNDVQPAPAGRLARWRLFLIEVRNELKRVTWPSRREVYATTVVVIVTSVAMGLYLWGLDLLFDWFQVWLIRRFGS